MNPANDLRIRTALARLGVADVVDWARHHCRMSLVDLNSKLNADVAPVRLEYFIRRAAAQARRYDEFIRIEAVRALNEHFPRGVASSDRVDFGFASGGSSWLSSFGSSSKTHARAVWRSIEARMREHSTWCPTDPDDPALLALFAGVSLEPTAAERRRIIAIGRPPIPDQMDVDPSVIRHVVASSTTSRVVLGAFGYHVEVWDLRTPRLVGRFRTVFAPGGHRLALSDEEDVLLAAAFTRHGVVAYQAASGDRLWERRDLKRVQQLTLSPDGTRAYCGRAGSSCEAVHVATGQTLERLRGTQWVVESPWDPVRLNNRANPAVEMLSGEFVCRIPRLTFAFLAATFAPGKLIVTESGGPVRCLSIVSGEELWRYQPLAGHVLDLAYRADGDRVVAIERFERSEPHYALVSLSAADGGVNARVPVNGEDHAFCERGQYLVASTRQVMDSRDAAVLLELDPDSPRGRDR